MIATISSAVTLWFQLFALATYPMTSNASPAAKNFENGSTVKQQSPRHAESGNEHLHEARIAYKGQTAVVMLRDDGTIARYEFPITWNDLPVCIRTYLQRYERRYQKASFFKVIGSNQTITFTAILKGSQLRFDAAGNKVSP